uniref:Mitochondrial import inner membrane translocase subunit Tim23 n=1 Tax=Cacopsylla melanoneura TaxID=428564 RepID=A0A8D8UVG2_9HEMI
MDPFGNRNLSDSPSIKVKSPYLDFDSQYLPKTSQPEFLVPEGTSKQRGRFELAFSQIGGSCILGATIGGAEGLYKGLRSTTLEGQTGKLRRTQLLNHVMKHGSATASTLGTIAVMYSSFGVLLQVTRGTDDDFNTLTAATATGMLFRSTGGLKKCGLGGAVGLGIASLYVLWNRRDSLSDFGSQYNPA